VVDAVAFVVVLSVTLVVDDPGVVVVEGGRVGGFPPWLVMEISAQA